MKRDTQIFDLIAAERSRQMHGIELIASENFVSDQVMEAMVLTGEALSTTERQTSFTQMITLALEVAVDMAARRA